MGGGSGGDGFRNTRGGKLGKQKRGTPRNNRAQNSQTNDIARKLNLTPKQQRELHDLIHGQNMGYLEILEFAIEWFKK